ncbi:MAG: hypothetical protein K9M55_05890 [Candidatus Marinimicrobia bacterium]|nr:hypothetical protein [Candidatus Neomarinimicrobiota bacterium]MCF7922215.1 hypothetical protein [Candidatus Neomarinimicrobiota bacterium]
MKQRKIIFTLLVALIPLAFLGLVELALWMVDAYPQPPLFIEVEESDQPFIQTNSIVSERYFNKNIMPVPELSPQKFSAEKPTGTLRIFCLGGSTTEGFPYEMTVPFPQQLAFLLEANYPDKAFEVINMGLSAINSFTVVDWIPEILRQDPDLILIYMGHNEFYGAYGPGSTISLGHDGRIVRLILKLHKFRVVQMISSMIRGTAKTPSSVANPTLREKGIESNSILRIKTRDNFSANLDIILKACQSAGVPVILSNLVSNIKDQAPLDATSNPQQPSSKANELYIKGLHEFHQGDTITAFISLTRAKNNDQVPLRGIDYFNEILHNKANKFDLPIVDMKAAFLSASPSNIPGNDLFCDHLHPNPVGYNLMAREFYQALNQTEILDQAPTPTLPGEAMFVTDLDWEMGSVRIFKQRHYWPFGNSPVDYKDYPALFSEKTAQIAKEYFFDHHFWGKAHNDMADYYLKQVELDKACREYQAMIEMYPEKTEYYAKLVECAREAQLWELVEQTCQSALSTTPAKGMFHYNLALSQKIAGNMEAAMSHIMAAIEAPELTRTQSAKVYFTYAQFLVDMQKPSEAATVLTEILNEVPDFIPAKELLDNLMN